MNIGIRILAVVLLCVSVLFLPFWFSAIFALALMFYFKNFLEAIFIFTLSDLIFGVGENNNNYVIFLSMFLFGILFLVVEYTKKKMRIEQ